MRKVIIGNSNEVSVEEVRENKFYGFLQGCSKGFVTRRDYMKGNFLVFGKGQVTLGNQWSGLSMEDENLSKMMRKMFSHGSFYEFDTAAQLFTWLAQE